MIFSIRRATLCAGAASLLAPAGAQSVADLRINEIMADNEATVANELGQFADWFELVNPTGVALEIGGLHLTDNAGDLTKWQIPAGEMIGPGERLLIWADDPANPNDPIFTDLHAPFGLSAQGESLTLVAANGLDVIDAVVFPPMNDDIAYARVPDTTGDFALTDQPTPRAPNMGDSGAAFPRLTELQVENALSAIDEVGDRDPWVEIVNASGVVIDLSGLLLTDEVGVPGKFAFPAGTALQPGERRLVWLDGEPGEGALHTPFALGAGGGTVTLHSADGTQVLDQIASGPLGPDRAVARFPNDTDAPAVTDRATPGARNEIFNAALGPVLHEIMADNVSVVFDELGEFEDWIEIRNLAAGTVSVASLYMTDDFDNPGQWQIPGAPGTLLGAGDSVAIWADGDLADGPLHAPFRLDAAGEQIGLFREVAPGTFEPIDTWVFGPQAEDASLALTSPGPHRRLPSASPTRGAANEFSLSLAQLADTLTGLIPLTPGGALASEADAKQDGQHDAADLVRRVNAGAPLP